MEDTIAAVATAYGEGGIGIIRISGENSLSILKEVFDPAADNKEITSRRMTYGKIIDKDADQIIDEVLAVYMKGPKTYTAEDVVEINCHGSMVSLRKTLALVLRKGARLAEPGEFTKRAFLNGRLDLSQAEAVIDVIKAPNGQHLLYVKVLEGTVNKGDNILTHVLKEKRYAIMKNHVLYGEALLAKCPGDIMQIAKTIALEHHERWDGSGYLGMKGDNISYISRLMAVCDVFDALTSQRYYKEGWSLEDTYNEIVRLKGIHFDPDVVDLFIEHFDEFEQVLRSMPDQQIY